MRVLCTHSLSTCASPSPIHSDGRDATFGNHHRAQTSRFELFELSISLALDKSFPVEQFEPTVSHSTVPFPPVKVGEHTYKYHIDIEMHRNM